MLGEVFYDTLWQYFWRNSRQRKIPNFKGLRLIFKDLQDISGKADENLQEFAAKRDYIKEQSLGTVEGSWVI